MKWLIRIFCVGVLALLMVGTTLHGSAAGHTGAAAASTARLADGLANLADKLAVIGALIAAMLGAQRTQWRWVIALVVLALLSVFSADLSGIVNDGGFLYVAVPAVAAIVALVYSYRMRDLEPARS